MQTLDSWKLQFSSYRDFKKSSSWKAIGLLFIITASTLHFIFVHEIGI